VYSLNDRELSLKCNVLVGEGDDEATVLIDGNCYTLHFNINLNADDRMAWIISYNSKCFSIDQNEFVESGTDFISSANDGQELVLLSAIQANKGVDFYYRK